MGQETTTTPNLSVNMQVRFECAKIATIFSSKSLSAWKRAYKEILATVTEEG